jgi:hypothetical protein
LEACNNPTVPRHRPKVAIALAIAAVALIALSVVSAVDVGYHIDGGSLMMPQHHQGHVYLHVFGNPPELTILAAIAMLCAAGHLGIVRRGARIGSMVAALLAAALVAFTCVGSTLFKNGFGETAGSTVAASSRYEVVRYNRPRWFGSDDIVLHLRSRNGLMSYEGGADLACFIEDSSGADSQWLFDHASLTANGSVLVTAKDGTTWQIRFDPHTLRPANPVDRCTDAPDWKAD